MDRRTGDTRQIDGGYQHRAIQSKNPVQRFWHASKLMLISDLLPPDASDFVLDVGCGSGVIASFLGKTSRRVLGIDGNLEAITYAREHFASENVSFLQGLVDDQLQLDEPPDKIYCLEVIEHIHEWQGLAMLKSFKNLLRPGGKVFLTTPNYRSLWPLIEYGMDHLTSAPKMQGDQHIAKYNAYKLTRLAKDAGFSISALATSCFLAPWMAPLSWRGAECMHRLETKSGIFPGSIIVCILRAE